MAKSVRVTIRLPEDEVEIMDALVEMGEYSSRSEFIRRAVREMNKEAVPEARETMEERQQLRETFLEMQHMKQQMEEMRETIDKLAKK